MRQPRPSPRPARRHLRPPSLEPTPGRYAEALIPEEQPLVGREQLLKELAEALSGGRRLLTLVGPPGVGKTRVARALALTPPRAIPTVAWCDLGEAAGPTELVSAVARGLGVEAPGLRADVELEEQIGLFLQHRGRSLVVLNGVDRCLDQAARMVTVWCARAPHARFLVTARGRLGAAGEQSREVPPLDPADAVGLYRQLAAAQRGDEDDTASPESDHAVAHLVHVLEHIPLSIELAAARSLVLTPDELVERLDARYAVLDQPGATGRAPRSLFQTLSLSWDLLSPTEQSALCQCALFGGGLTLEAAEAVVEIPTGHHQIDVVESLVRLSLLTSRRHRETGNTRFFMYDYIRAFAVERGADQPALIAGAALRHARFFAERGARWSSEANGPGAQESRSQLDAEHQNLLLALDHSRATQPRLAVQLAAAIDVQLASHGPPGVHLEVLDAAVTASDTLNPAEQIRALLARGRAHTNRGDPERADRDLARAATRARDHRLPELEVEVVLGQSHLALRRGLLDEARPLLARAVELSERGGWARLLGQALDRRGVLHLFGGSRDAAVEDLQRAVELHAQGPDLLWLGISYSNLGAVHLDRGELTEARSVLEAALDAAAKTGELRIQGAARVNLGLISFEQGDHAASRVEVEEALEALQRVGYRKGVAEALELLATLDLFADDAAAARQKLDVALAEFRLLDNGRCEARALAHLALTECARGCYGAATRLGAQAQQRVKQVEAPYPVAIERAVGVVNQLKRRGQETEGHSAPAPSDSWPIELRLLAAVMAHLLGRAPSATSRTRPVASTPPVRLSAAARWFEVSGEPRVSLARRGAMRLILERLISAHRSDPDSPLDTYTLVDAGWPGQEIRPDIGAARVYESLRVLRRLGLEPYLLYRDGGYLLDPAATFEVVEL